jgi:phage terminase large subunit
MHSGVLRIETAEVFRPLLEPARYKGAHGGRGSGKSHFFAGMGIELCLLKPGTSIVAIREVQRTLAQSSKRLLESTIQKFEVGRHFETLHDRIKTPGGGLIIFQGMTDHTAESIKVARRLRRGDGGRGPSPQRTKPCAAAADDSQTGQ